jgi:hypothetical protein
MTIELTAVTLEVNFIILRASFLSQALLRGYLEKKKHNNETLTN